MNYESPVEILSLVDEYANDKKCISIIDLDGAEYEVIASKIKIGHTFYWHYDDCYGIDRLMKCKQEDE
ncbi:MAG: hypothetical protein PHS42_04950 [Sulfurimonas sp.]|nr:hypothetical protein [Sulfurimonas sp.]